jgi:hypothetical protein
MEDDDPAWPVITSIEIEDGVVFKLVTVTGSSMIRTERYIGAGAAIDLIGAEIERHEAQGWPEEPSREHMQRWLALAREALDRQSKPN